MELDHVSAFVVRVKKLRPVNVAERGNRSARKLHFEIEPDVPEDLLGMENVVLTPHVASAANEAKNAMVQLVVDNFVAHFSGKPLVTPIGDQH